MCITFQRKCPFSIFYQKVVAYSSKCFSIRKTQTDSSPAIAVLQIQPSLGAHLQDSPRSADLLEHTAKPDGSVSCSESSQPAKNF